MRDRKKMTAHEQIRSLAVRGGYRIDHDAEGFPVIPGRLGGVEWHDPEGRELAVYTDRPRLFPRLLAVPAVRRHQTGDHELRALFPVEALAQVARLIKARRRRSQTSPESVRNSSTQSGFAGLESTIGRLPIPEGQPGRRNVARSSITAESEFWRKARVSFLRHSCFGKDGGLHSRDVVGGAPTQNADPSASSGGAISREPRPRPASPPRLLDRVRDAIRARNFSRRTEKAYVHWTKRYIFFHGKRHPAEMGAPEVTAFLTSLAVQDKVAASTQNQALSALLFLYRDVLGVDLGEHSP